MTHAPRITLKIDRIVTDGVSLDRARLESALHQALTARYVAHGADGFGPSRHLAGGQAAVASDTSPLTARVAQAVVKASAGGPK